MPSKKKLPLVFVSYAPFDDRHELGRVSALTGLLAEGLQFHRGAEFSMVRDRNPVIPEEDNEEDNEESIPEALKRAAAFVAIVTPNYLKSRHCRAELSQFLKREEKLKREDMVIPILYIGDSGDLKQDELGEKLARRGFVDWRGLRFERFDSERVRDKLDEVTVRVEYTVEGE